MTEHYYKKPSNPVFWQLSNGCQRSFAGGHRTKLQFSRAQRALKSILPQWSEKDTKVWRTLLPCFRIANHPNLVEILVRTDLYKEASSILKPPYYIWDRPSICCRVSSVNARSFQGWTLILRLDGAWRLLQLLWLRCEAVNGTHGTCRGAVTHHMNPGFTQKCSKLIEWN